MAAVIELSQFERVALAALLRHRMSDGLVFVRSRDDRKLLKKAKGLGLVDSDGYLTQSGVRFKVSVRE